MTENDIAVHLRTWLLANIGERLGGMVPEVTQSYQPVQQGRIDGPALVFHFLPERRVGQRKNDEVLDVPTLTMRRRELQVIESPVQFTALAPTTPADSMGAVSPATIAKAAAAVFGTPEFIKSLKLQSAGVLAISQIRNLPFENDRGQYEYAATFDVTITHTDEFLSEIKGAAGYSVEINRV